MWLISWALSTCSSSAASAKAVNGMKTVLSTGTSLNDAAIPFDIDEHVAPDGHDTIVPCSVTYSWAYADGRSCQRVCELK